MQDPRMRLREYMEENGLNQTHLASLAKVSQATVCRALSENAKRRGSARAKLFIYVGLSEYLEIHKGNPRDHVLNAFERIWDGSKSHAESVARVISAMADLRPQSHKRKRT